MTLTDDVLTQLLDEVASSYAVPEHGPDEILAALDELPARTPFHRRRWVQLSAAAAVVLVGAAFAVNRHDVTGSTVAAGRSDSAMKAAPAARTPLTGGVAGGGATTAALSDQQRTLAPAGSAWTSGTYAEKEFAPSAGAATAGTAASGAAPAAVPAPPVLAAMPRTGAPTSQQVTAPFGDDGEGRVVKSGSIALVVKDGKVTPTLTAVERAAKQQGGYIASGNTQEYGDTPSGEVTIRVPVAHFESLVDAVRGLDAKVRTASTEGRDVTAQYSDLEAQLRSLKASRERFYTILTKASTIGEILTVQQRIDNVSGQIDRIEGQRKLLADQSDLSTLTVSVSEAGDPVVKATTKPRSGISQAFHDAWDGFVSGVESIIAHSGRVLLLLICAALLLLVARGGWRVARRRMV